MESFIEDYRTIDGVNIAHAGKTSVSLFRFGETTDRHSRTRMEEAWSIEEVDFNIKGLSMDCFLPPSDLKKEEEGEVDYGSVVARNARMPFKIRATGSKVYPSKIVAIDDDDSDHNEEDYE